MIWLHPLLLIPAALCLALFVWRKIGPAGDDWARVVSAPVLGFLRPPKPGLRRNLALLALGVVFAALASPSIRADGASSYALDEGILIMVDVSKSMGVDDIRPNRMAAARAAVQQISARASARPIALIAYAGDAYLVQPFAIDRRGLDAFAAALEVRLIRHEGSNLERALALATSVIGDSRIDRARIVLVSDSGGFSSAIPIIAARLAADRNRLDVVLVADPATTTPVSVDLASIKETVARGHGALVTVNGDGLADLRPLDLDANLLDQRPVSLLGLRSSDWRNYSHYLLLLALAALLLAFRQARP